MGALVGALHKLESTLSTTFDGAIVVVLLLIDTPELPPPELLDTFESNLLMLPILTPDEL